MEQILIDAINERNRLLTLREKQTAALTSLSEYEHLILVSSPVNDSGRVYYYSKNPGKTRRKYLGDASNDIVQCIQKAHYLRQSVAAIDRNIRLLTDFLNGYQPVDFESVRASLPKAYRSLTSMPDVPLPPAADQWLAEKLAYKARFPVRHPEGLRIRTADGTLVRSKSEAILSNLLSSNSIPYVYELPHVINGIDYRTDFTALSLIDLTTEKCIEHQGLMGDPRYERLFLQKLNDYRHAGFTPGYDVFFTFDDPDGGLDVYAIQKIIDNYLKPQP